MGIHAGWSFDITTYDVDGRMSAFNEVEMRNRAIRKILSDEPLLLIGSTMCTAFSVMNTLNYVRMSKGEVERRKAYGRKH